MKRALFVLWAMSAVAILTLSQAGATLGRPKAIAVRGTVNAADVPPSASPTPPPTPSPQPAVSPLLGVPNMPSNLFFALPSPQPSAIPPSKIVTIIISGIDPKAVTLNEQVRYAFESVHDVLLKYGIVTMIYDDIASTTGATTYCGSSMAGIPFLYTTLRMNSGSNKYTSGYHSVVDFSGWEGRCVSAQQIQPVSILGSNPPRIVAFQGHEDHTYYANPFQGALEMFALSSSPWVTKNKIFVTAPATLLDSFVHVSDAANGAVYCAVAAAMSQFLQEPNPVTDASPDPNLTPSPPPASLIGCGAERRYNKQMRRQAGHAIF